MIDIDDPNIWTKTDIFLNNVRLEYIISFNFIIETKLPPRVEIVKIYASEDSVMRTQLSFESFMLRIEQIHDGLAFHFTSGQTKEVLLSIEDLK